jgi:hypothetical protein
MQQQARQHERATEQKVQENNQRQENTRLNQNRTLGYTDDGLRTERRIFN